jgi:glycosyltransferase involved in cell wall biosynthesis
MCDLFILPSAGPGETWGLVLNEAMACGVPIAATDKCGGAIDLIENEKNGYIFKSGDVAGLSKILSAFAADKEKAKLMSEYSREKIKKFSYNVLAEIIENELANDKK